MPRPRRYLWADWLSRPRVVLTYRKHFDCSIKTMMQQVRNAASARGVAVSVVRLKGAKILILTQQEARA